MAVIINGRDLTIEQVISVCRHHEKVELAPEAVEACLLYTSCFYVFQIFVLHAAAASVLARLL